MQERKGGGQYRWLEHGRQVRGGGPGALTGCSWSIVLSWTEACWAAAWAAPRDPPERMSRARWGRCRAASGSRLQAGGRAGVRDEGRGSGPREPASTAVPPSSRLLGPGCSTGAAPAAPCSRPHSGGSHGAPPTVVHAEGAPLEVVQVAAGQGWGRWMSGENMTTHTKKEADPPGSCGEGWGGAGRQRRWGHGRGGGGA